jgi:hypothetical protein
MSFLHIAKGLCQLSFKLIYTSLIPLLFGDYMRKPLIFLLSSLLSISSFASIEFAREMTNKMLDFHAQLDDLESYNDLSKSVMVNTASKLVEKDQDKDLAPIVVIVNRAPKGTAPDAQLARVYVDGRLVKTVKVSTGKIGYETRTGYYRPVYTNHLRFYDEYYSSKYNSRMARAIFFVGGYALHHTDAVNLLGDRASSGCVRFKLEDIDWINKTAMEMLGNQTYQKRAWHHANHNKSMQNVHYVGLHRNDVNPIHSTTGKIDYSKQTNSLDMVILVKDQRSSDR